MANSDGPSTTCMAVGRANVRSNCSRNALTWAVQCCHFATDYSAQGEVPDRIANVDYILTFRLNP
jgi:hypothetical protein